MLKDIQEQKDFYDKYWQGLEPLSTYKVARTKWILDVLLRVRKQFAGGKVRLLDLGCGDGRLLPLWQAVTGADAYGLDLSPQAMQIAAQKFPSIHYTDGDATQTTYKDDFFDVIICQEVLEHVSEQSKLIKECSRILKNGACLVLTTPNQFYFDHRKGGNYSNQPIENIIDKKQLLELLAPYFRVQSYETLIYAKGDRGIYQLVTNRYYLGLLRRAGLENSWKQFLLKKGYGLHMAVVCHRQTRN